MNKAHTATVNRISKRYGIRYNEGDGFDFECDRFVIEVETTATLEVAMQQLGNCGRPAYVAMTNIEGVGYALRVTKGSAVGVMDPQGAIVREFSPI